MRKSQRITTRRIKGFPRRVKVTRRKGGKERVQVLDKWHGLSRGVPATCFDQRAVRKGMRVEMEHTDKPYVAMRIAKDHLTEDSEYYDKLEKMESGRKRLSTCKA